MALNREREREFMEYEDYGENNYDGRDNRRNNNNGNYKNRRNNNNGNYNNGNYNNNYNNNNGNYYNNAPASSSAAAANYAGGNTGEVRNPDAAPGPQFQRDYIAPSINIAELQAKDMPELSKTVETLDPNERQVLFDCGAEFAFITFVDGFSTTKTISKMAGDKN